MLTYFGPNLCKLNVYPCSRRFVSNDELFNALVSRAIKTDSHRWAVGGNAPVMALRFALEGAKVLLSAKITEDMRRGLHESIAVAESSVVDEDDVHLILVGTILGTHQKSYTQKTISFMDRFHSIAGVQERGEVGQVRVSSGQSLHSSQRREQPDRVLPRGL